MLWSQTLIPTLREDPHEAEIPSHRLLLRAGMVRRVAAGLYTFLPLGLRALRKVETIIREEMDRAGALEILMPALQPRELWETTRRLDTMGDVLFRLRDRQQREMVLGPTHEEVITDLAAREIRSHRQMPRTFYQIQTKFRDELRPRYGLIRAKEFIMKDAYSFDRTAEEAERSYQAMYEAYVRIFQRCGLTPRIVEADTGAIGGSASHEFMVPAEHGEDIMLECPACGYGANRERAERFVADAQQAETPRVPPPEPVATPNQKSIEQVSRFLGCRPEDLIKTMIYVADGHPIAVLISGDREVNDIKLRRVVGVSTLAPAEDRVVEEVTGAPVGFAGPMGLRIPIYADVGLRRRADRIAGANRADWHVRHVDLLRDATITAYADLAFAAAGDLCPRCHRPMQETHGIEVGHVFKLGTKYTECFGAAYLDDQGLSQPILMGCYGIGVTRTLQAVVEQHWDDHGICWPPAVAPYRVEIVVLDPLGEGMDVTRQLASDLERRGVDVLVDDRDERAGVKFKDADLVGCPIRVIMGDKGLRRGCVEWKRRTDRQAEWIPIKEAADHLARLCRVETAGVPTDPGGAG